MTAVRTIVPGNCMVLLSPNKASSSFRGESFSHSFPNSSRPRLLSAESSRRSACPRKSLEAHCAKANCQIGSSALRASQTCPMLAVYPRLLLLVLPQVVAAFAKVYRVQLAVLFHHHHCEVEVTEPFLPCRCVFSNSLRPSFIWKNESIICVMFFDNLNHSSELCVHAVFESKVSMCIRVLPCVDPVPSNSVNMIPS